jgi:hypothetical protein
MKDSEMDQTCSTCGKSRDEYKVNRLYKNCKSKKVKLSRYHHAGAKGRENIAPTLL